MLQFSIIGRMVKGEIGAYGAIFRMVTKGENGPEYSPWMLFDHTDGSWWRTAEEVVAFITKECNGFEVEPKTVRFHETWIAATPFSEGE